MNKIFKDQLGNSVTISFPPSRIISLVPSQTELLAELNLSTEVVGITKYCVFPTQWAESKAIVGGTKDFNIRRILDLHPDLIIGNKEENKKELIEALMPHAPVWMSDINSLTNALSMIESVGEITNRVGEARFISTSIQKSFDRLKPIVHTNHTVLYLIWRKPWMGVASNTFIHNMLERIGFKNCLETSERYPELSPETLSALNPDYIFLSSEPYPFKEKHIKELQAFCPSSRILLVDGQMFSWYGSRLTKAVDYFRSLKL